MQEEHKIDIPKGEETLDGNALVVQIKAPASLFARFVAVCNKMWCCNCCSAMIKNYLLKVTALPQVQNPSPLKSPHEMIATFFVTFVSLLVICTLHYVAVGDSMDMLIAPFGATAVLAYGELASPLAQVCMVKSTHFSRAMY